VSFIQNGAISVADSFGATLSTWWLCPTQQQFQDMGGFSAQPSYSLFDISLPPGGTQSSFCLKLDLATSTHLGGPSPPYAVGFFVYIAPADPDKFAFWQTAGEVWLPATNTIGLLFGAWNHTLVAVDANHTGGGDPKICKVYLNGASVSISSSADGSGGTAFQMALNNAVCGVPGTAWDRDPANSFEFGFDLSYKLPMQVSCTQFYRSFIDPAVSNNLAKFVRLDADNKPLLPADIRAAEKAFGTPDIWLVRDSVSGVKYEDNQGTAGDFTVVGTSPQDFFPGPGQ